MVRNGRSRTKITRRNWREEEKIKISKIGYYYDSNGVKHFGKIPTDDGIPED